MAKFCPLFSGSTGNASYIGSAGCGILIDVGRSARQTEAALFSIGVDPDSIRAVFITHEHTDHISGVRVFAAKHHVRVFATGGTLRALEDFGICDGKFRTEVVPAEGAQVGGLLVKPFCTRHDCRESCGYTVDCGDGRRLAVATDLGEMTKAVAAALTGCDLVLLESNHDVGMLKNGPYPYALKMRILGKHGHLSNDACSEAAVKLVACGTTRLILGHLSRENNLPELAYQTTFAALLSAGAKEGVDYVLKVAKPVWDERAIVL